MWDFRSYERLEVELVPGLVLVAGPNGAGKTNLLESLHVGTQGFSPRTRSDLQLIRFGERSARVAVRGTIGDSTSDVEVILRVGEGKAARVNGARLKAAEQLRLKVSALVFTPDRLAVVKGAPAARRAYFDRVLGRLFPARANLPAEYAAAVGQRNAALRRTAAGFSSSDVVAPWTAQVVERGGLLVEARRQTIELLDPRFSEQALALMLSGADLQYKANPPTVEALEAVLARDLERGTTSLGPHLDDVAVVAGGRDLRSFGSQGEQRLALLALLLAEAELILERRGVPPLLLLDDVLSELDSERRTALIRRLPAKGQTLITTTDVSVLTKSPDQLLTVEPGRVRSP